jgi:hypothetical protein
MHAGEGCLAVQRRAPLRRQESEAQQEADARRERACVAHEIFGDAEGGISDDSVGSAADVAEVADAGEVAQLEARCAGVKVDTEDDGGTGGAQWRHEIAATDTGFDDDTPAQPIAERGNAPRGNVGRRVETIERIANVVGQECVARSQAARACTIPASVPPGV